MPRRARIHRRRPDAHALERPHQHPVARHARAAPPGRRRARSRPRAPKTRWPNAIWSSRSARSRTSADPIAATSHAASIGSVLGVSHLTRAVVRAGRCPRTRATTDRASRRAWHAVVRRPRRRISVIERSYDARPNGSVRRCHSRYASMPTVSALKRSSARRRVHPQPERERAPRRIELPDGVVEIREPAFVQLEQLRS